MVKKLIGSVGLSPGTDTGFDLTTKGDTHGYSTTNARIPIGSNDQVLTADSTTALGLKWATSVGGSVDPSIVVMSNSETIGDYTQPSDSVCSSSASSGTTKVTITGTFPYEHSMYNGGETAKGLFINSGASLLGETVVGMTFWLKSLGSPTGTLYFRCYNSSSVLQATFGTLDVSTLTTSFVEKDSGIVTDSHTIAIDDRLVVEYSGGDASNTVIVNVDASCLYDCGQTTATTLTAGGSWSNNANNDFHMSFTHDDVQNPCSNAIDDDVATSWLSSTETNPNIYVDMSSSTTTSNLALYPNTGTTETEITIQSSDNASDWATQRTITWSNLTEGAWNYIRFNIVSARYWRIYGNSGASVDMQIDEIKVLDSVSDSDVGIGHGHLSISSSDTSLDNAGE